MSDQEISVRLSAQTAEFRQAMVGAAEETERAVARIKAALKILLDAGGGSTKVIGGHFEELAANARSGLDKAASAVAGSVGKMSGQLDSLNKASGESAAKFGEQMGKMPESSKKELNLLKRLLGDASGWVKTQMAQVVDEAAQGVRNYGERLGAMVEVSQKHTSQAAILLTSSAKHYKESFEKISTGVTSASQLVATQTTRMAGSVATESAMVAAASNTSMGSMAAGTRSSIGGMAVTFARAVGIIGAVITVVVDLGKALWKVGEAALNISKEMSKMAGGVNSFARSLGTTTATAQAYRVALQTVGASEDEFKAGRAGLAEQLKTNEEGLKRLGLETRNASGEQRSLDELFIESLELTQKYKTGVDQTKVAQELFGGAVSTSSNLLGLNKKTVEDSEKAVRDLRMEVGPNSVKASQEFDAALERSKLALTGVKKTISDAVMPILTSLLEMFNSAMPVAIDVLRSALAYLLTQFYELKQRFTIYVEQFRATFRNLAAIAFGFVSAVEKIFKGDFRGAWDSLKTIGTHMAENFEEGANRVAEAAIKAREHIKLVTTGDQSKGEATGTGTLTYKPAAEQKPPDDPRTYGATATSPASASATNKDDGKGKGNSGRGGYTSTGTTRVKADGPAPAPSMPDAPAPKDGGGPCGGCDETELSARLEEQRRFERQRVQVAKEGSAQTQQVCADEVQATRDSTQEKVAMEEHANAKRVDSVKLTHEELLALEELSEQHLYEIKHAALQRLMEEQPADQNPEKYAQLKLEIEALERQHQERMAEIRAQFNQKAGPLLGGGGKASPKGGAGGGKKDGAAGGKEEETPGATVFKAMEQEFSNSIDAMINKGMTWRKALTNIFKATLQAFIKEYIVKKIMAETMAAIRQTAIGQALLGTKIGQDQAGAASGMASKSQETTANVGMSAIEAAANAFKAMAGIPYVGPILAVAAAAAAMSAVMGLLGGGGGGSKTTTTSTRIPSAAAGFDIPAGLNPLTQLHEKEMVLPAEHAQAIRDMAGGSGGSAGVGAVHLHVSAMDARDVKRFLMDNRGAVADALKGAVRDFKR